MTKSDAPRFGAAMAKLAIVHREAFDRPSAMVYFDALTDVPIDALEAALDYLTKHAGPFFPKTEQIRLVCDEQERVRAVLHSDPPAQSQFLLEVSQADHVEKVVRLPSGPMTVKVAVGVSGSTCDRCDDSGWKQLCVCDNPGTCRRRDGDYCGEYKNGSARLPVRRCECSQTNPEIMRRRQAEKAAAPTKYAAKKERNFYERD